MSTKANSDMTSKLCGLTTNEAKALVRSMHAFDDIYYAAQCKISVESGTDLLEHYLENSSNNPHPCFNSSHYLSENADVATRGFNPLIHYLLYGIKEGRSTRAGFHLTAYAARHPSIDFRRTSFFHHYTEFYGTTVPENCAELLLGNHSLFKNLTADQIETLSSAIKNRFFDGQFYFDSNPDIARAKINPFAHYLSDGWRELRNPSPLFDTGFYLEKNPDVAKSGMCPLLHYLKHGHRERRLPVPSYAADFTTLGHEARYKTSAKIAVHAHIFYPELTEEICQALNNMPIEYDAYISTTTEANAQYIKNCLKDSCTAKSTVIHVVPNIGRDIYPMLGVFGSALSRYDYICHIHTKRSRHCSFGAAWRHYLFDRLLGSSALISRILCEFDSRPDLGFAFPDNYREIKPFVKWAGNQEAVLTLFRRMGLPTDILELEQEFAAGSMCWIRVAALRPLFDLELQAEDFEDEAGQLEGTLAHAIERCLPHVARARGYEIIKYYAGSQGLFRGPSREDSTTPPLEISNRWARDTVNIARNRLVKLAPLSRTYNPSSLNLHWVIPDFGRGAGGHMTIFRMVYWLEKFGHRQTIWIQNARNHASENEARHRIQEWYQPISDKVIVRFLQDDVAGISGDAVIATDMWTAFPVGAMPLFKERFYFVQDYEAFFHARGSHYFLAEYTYRMGFKALCAGAWLHSMLSRNSWSRQWNLAYDPTYYFRSANESSTHQLAPATPTTRIAFYARRYTPRRAVDLGLIALDILHDRGIKFHVDFFGEEDLGISPEYSHHHHGILNASELGALYRNSDIGVVFSGTNYSLIPMEMMACGLPVVELDTDSTRAVFPPDTVEFALPSPVDIADAIAKLQSSSNRREELIQGGLRFISNLSWESSARDLEHGLLDGISEDNTALLPATAINARVETNYVASVIIPTFNAGRMFEEVLNRVLEQKCDWPFEVLVVDSGSTDGTVELIKCMSSRGVRLHQIPNHEFQHGRTRNLAISLTSSEFVAVITQDATPRDDFWLKELVNSFHTSDLVAGVFGAHEAYPHHSQFVQHDIERHFRHINMLPRVVSWERGLPSHIPMGSDQWQQNLHFFSDNNACIRRSIWEKIPYPEIDWGEDQAWAWEIVKQGYEKAFAPDAVVYHSHDLSYEQQLNVSTIESEFFLRYFNYRLIKNRDMADTQLAAANMRDRQLANELGISNAELQERFLTNKAAVLGRYQGASRLEY